MEFEEIGNTTKEVCEQCKGTGIVKNEKGIHVCYDCLREGRLDVHSKDLKESKIRI